jgi:hypothetical protein
MAESEPYWVMVAREAGLDKALLEHYDDIAAAAASAATAAKGFAAPSDPRAEPWPPMRMGSGL